jgi:HAD superfamily hydrolase (TIGR01509 family)
MQYNYWIFDMDGTLTDSMGIWDEVPFMLLSLCGRTPKPGLREALLPMGMAETARYMITEYELPFTEAEFEAKTVALKEGVADWLAELRRRGAHLCVCSNTWQSMCEEVLTALGVRQYFEFILSAQDGFTKKEPAIFLEAARRLGAPDPAHCIVCEDAVHAIRTAHAAGFAVLGIADYYSRADEAEIRALSDWFIPSWPHLDRTKV